MATKKKSVPARAVAKSRAVAKVRTAAKVRGAVKARAAAKPATSTVGKRMTHRDVVAQLSRRKAEYVRPLMMETPMRHVRPAIGHKFRTGQMVTLLPNRYGSDRNGSFEVTRLLPEEHGVNHYRLKSAADGHERVAGEDELI